MGRDGGELLRALLRTRGKMGTLAGVLVGALLVAPQLGVPFAGGSWRSAEADAFLVVPIVTPTPEPTPQPRPAPAARATQRPALPQTSSGRWVYASWYGCETSMGEPCFFGRRTACGQIYGPEIMGIAHKTLRCGTMTQITYNGKTVTVPVIDRGPYVAGREVDLSYAVKKALGFSGVRLVYFVVLQ